MKRLLFLSLFLFHSLLNADPKDPHVSAVTEGEPSWNLCRTVNAITGDLFISQDDLIIPAVQPIHISRHYISGDGKGYNGGWEFMPHLCLILRNGYKDKRQRIVVSEPNGSPIQYRQHRTNPDYYELNIDEDGDGITNYSKGIISGRTNLKNNTIKRFSKHKLEMLSADGTTRFYECHHKTDPDDKGNRIVHFYLQREHHPNGNWTTYHYDKEKRITLIETHNPSKTKTYTWALFHYHGKPESTHNFHIETKDGQTIHYNFDKLEKGRDSFYLKSVSSPQLPHEQADYCSGHSRRGPLVNRRLHPSGRSLNAFYYKSGKNQVGSERVTVQSEYDPICDRVRTLASPIGDDSTPIETHRFYYAVEYHRRKENNSHYRYAGNTRVHDHENNQTLFHFTRDARPDRIEHFQNIHGSQVLVSAERYEWENGINLRSKKFVDPNGHLLQSRILSYDGRGNVLEDRLYGNITGKNPTPATHENSLESYTIRYNYNERHLTTFRQEENGHTTYFNYLPGTDLIIFRFTGDAQRIQLREFFEYDNDHILIRVIKDDGSSLDKNNLADVSQRTFQVITPRQSEPALGLPEIIEDRYLDLLTGEEKLLKKIGLTYSSQSKVTQQDIYDANNTLRYSLFTTYNAMGLPETQTDPFGYTSIAKYDEFGNKVYTEDPSLISTHTYDYCNRLIQTVEKTPQSQRSTTHRYDGKHNKRSSTDPFNNQTRYTYDAFGNNLETHLPPILDEQGNLCNPIIKKTYDALNREITTIDPRGHTTEKRYTIRNKPYLIIHPDGTQEHYLYYPNGALKETIDQEGTKTTYTYDILERILTKKTYSPSDTLLTEESYTYNAFNLLSKTDAEGNTTNYTYDGAGRLIAESSIDLTTHTYDPLGRLHTTQIGDSITIKEYDLLDRVIEETETDLDGNSLTRVSSRYDDAGNKTQTIHYTSSGPSIHTTIYDGFKRPISIQDSLGHITTIQYDDQHRNPHGHLVLRKITIDPLNIQTIEIHDTHGRLVSLEKLDSLGRRIAYLEQFYDLAGNLSRKLDHVIANFNTIRIVETLWHYGPKKQLLSLTEAANTPEERITTYTYTPKGQIEHVYKPDGVIITHTYDPLGRLETILSSDQTIHYHYHYNKIHQIQAIDDLIHNTTITRTYDPKNRLLSETLNNLTLSSTYTPRGQKKSLTLPDQSSIIYTYQGPLLTTIDRYSTSGNHLYSHHYLSYDPSGRLLLQQHLNNHLTTTTIDLLGRTTSTNSPSFSQQIIEYNPVGSVINTLTNNLPSHYTYDSLNKLIQEPLHTYTYDSHNNRLEKDATPNTINPLNQLLFTPTTTFTYNLNGAPTLKQTTDTTRYTYDALDRLTSIETPTTFHIFTYDAWHRRLSHTLDNNTLYFLYDDFNEIGACDASGKIIQLRVLGIGSGAEIGASISIELLDKIYTPIHDLFGNIVRILDHTTLSQDFTAFGETTSPINTPWGFSSKRHDPYTDLIFFGRRYYDPINGRWLTPDPAGYTEGPNLYAFLLNTPLTQTDPYGLFPLIEAMRIGHNIPQQAMDFPPYMRGEYSLSDYHYIATPANPQPLIHDPRPPGIICLINGVGVKMHDAFNRANEIADGYGVVCHAIYNPTHNIVFDLAKCGLMKLGLGGHNNSTVLAIREICIKASNHFGPSLSIFLLPHSMGGLDLYYGVNSLPHEIRRQIHIVALAPATIIPKDLTADVWNYASKGFDPVVLYNHAEVLRGISEGNMYFLDRAQGAPAFMDHSAESPTFKPIINKHLQAFISENNCNISWQK